MPWVIRFKSSFFKLALLLLVAVLLLSCETLGYYTQAARGQLFIVFNRQNIDDLLLEDELSSSLRAKLTQVLLIREFAQQQLHLPLNNSYRSYVELGRDHVVWNVFAAPEFSTTAVRWCYPIAGCVSYRGYFSQDSAEQFAQSQQAQGYDVYMGGVDAYSTLGWFEDSLLSTVINRSDHQLAALIFHELAHQLLYVPGDTVFNESFATFLEQEGLRRWLGTNQQSEIISQAQLEASRQEEFVTLVTRYRDSFDTLYEMPYENEVMRQHKRQLQQDLREEYQLLKLSWQGYAGFDAWFSRSLNNAQLSTVASYNDLVPVFEELLEQAQGSLSDFYLSVHALADLSDDKREAKLESLR